MIAENIQRPCWFCKLGMDQLCLDPQKGEAHLYTTCQGHRLRRNIIGIVLRCIARLVRKNHDKH
jgi:hypothetical protein